MTKMNNAAGGQVGKITKFKPNYPPAHFTRIPSNAQPVAEKKNDANEDADKNASKNPKANAIKDAEIATENDLRQPK